MSKYNSFLVDLCTQEKCESYNDNDFKPFFIISDELNRRHVSTIALRISFSIIL